MGLLGTTTQQQYYTNTLAYTGNGSTTAFDFDSDINGASFDPLPAYVADFVVYFDGVEQASTLYDATPYNSATGVLTFDSAPADGVAITVTQITPNESLGNYQYIGINDIVNNFIISYVGKDKIIPKVKRADIFFHAQRALAEMSYDTLRSNKSQEIEIPPALTMALPHDYVNYVKLSWLDNDGVERLILPARKTSNPSAILQDSNYDYLFDADGSLLNARDSDTWTQFQSSEGNNTSANNISDSEDIDKTFFLGQRYGIDPEYASSNGLFYIDNARGMVYFSSNLTGMTVKLSYISDTLGLDSEMQIHKLAEEAMYKWIAHAVIATRAQVPEYIVARFKKERFAAIRTAKLRLSNLKSEELVQIMRGKSKQIKH
jgi:hypothetical protein